MSDSGKHHAVASHQNSDGTFEFVMETVEEPSSFVEDSEVSEVSDTPEDLEPLPSSSPIRFVIPVAAIGLLIGCAAALMWVVNSDFGAEEEKVDVVPGFRAYTGGGATPDPRAKTQRARITRPVATPDDSLEPDDETEVQDDNDIPPVPEPVAGNARGPEPEDLEVTEPSEPLRILPNPSSITNLNPNRQIPLSDRVQNRMPRARINPAELPAGLRNANLQQIPRDDEDSQDGEVVEGEDGEEVVVDSNGEVPEDFEDQVEEEQ